MGGIIQKIKNFFKCVCRIKRKEESKVEKKPEEQKQA